jgi:hypothetical protein
LGRSVQGMHPGGERAAPERPGETRCKPSRGRAWLRKSMVSKRSDERPTGNLPLPRHILHTWHETPGLRGSDCIQCVQKDDRGLEFACPSHKGCQRLLELPSDQSGYREERDGSWVSHHLTTFVESIAMNVGGPYVESAVLNEA